MDSARRMSGHTYRAAGRVADDRAGPGQGDYFVSTILQTFSAPSTSAEADRRGPAIEVHGLTKTYRGGVRALDGLSFAVEYGTIFALIGPNGAGKSTVVKILT